MHKEKLAGNGIIVQSTSGGSTSVFSTGQSISIQSVHSNVIHNQSVSAHSVQSIIIKR